MLRVLYLVFDPYYKAHGEDVRCLSAGPKAIAELYCQASKAAFLGPVRTSIGFLSSLPNLAQAGLRTPFGFAATASFPVSHPVVLQEGAAATHCF
eukprot:7172061-Lingulodinium_polyedra.AAC.1